ncbi:MoaD/ThiS family protein [Deferrisoma camini]|uniref:MoaD/ThiS family protein n=1 Tax=Deferrisoma camini TaxID=1035120 RepID=UPI00046CB7EF|nr:MoaD/ThiS family protein [Deferrisoma camini]
MAIVVRFLGFPEIKRILGRTEFRVEADPPTLAGLLEALRAQGVPVDDAVVTEEGHVRPTVQVIRNGDDWIPRDRPDTPLGPDDEITFLFMMAGG